MRISGPDRNQQPKSPAKAQQSAPAEALSTELSEAPVSLRPRTLPPPPPSDVTAIKIGGPIALEAQQPQQPQQPLVDLLVEFGDEANLDKVTEQIAMMRKIHPDREVTAVVSVKLSQVVSLCYSPEELLNRDQFRASLYENLLAQMEAAGEHGCLIDEVEIVEFRDGHDDSPLSGMVMTEEGRLPGWSRSDSEAAMMMGWEIFSTDRGPETEGELVDGKPYGHRPFEVQRLDDPPEGAPHLANDAAAWALLVEGVDKGDSLCVKARDFLKQFSPAEYEAIFKGR